MSIKDKTLIDFDNLYSYHNQSSSLNQAKLNILANAVDDVDGRLTDLENNFGSSINTDYVHTLANDYPTGLNMDALFELGEENIYELDYSSWESNTDNIQNIISNWSELCSFIKDVKDNTIITCLLDSYGGDKQLMYVDIEEYNEESDYKSITIISISTYAYLPITSHIRLNGVSSSTDDDKRCTITIQNFTDEILIASKEYVQKYVSEENKNLATKSEGIYYVEGNSTTAGTWTGTNSRITSYYDGLTIIYKTNIAGASTTTLNINDLGAKTVYRYGSTKLTTHYPASAVVMITYMADLNSGCWMVSSDYDSNTDNVHTMPNDYEFGIYLDQVFELIDNSLEITYESLTANTDNIQSIVYDWSALCSFLANVQDNTIITALLDSYGGDRQLLYIDVQELNTDEDYKIITIISINTYAYAPITSQIRLDGYSSALVDDRLCTVTLVNHTDEVTIASKEYVHEYVDSKFNELANMEYGE